MEVPEDRGDGVHACASCGAHVSPAFVRVFGDNQNVVHGCPRCGTRRERAHGDGL